jgi:hypothetical protein
MLGALYYPHTAVRDENFLKHALLYWDQIEYISPWEDFDALPRYLTESTKALSKFLVPHVPTKTEKERAHAEIMGLIDNDLPSWLQMDRVAEADDRRTYSMFRDKLLPETWRELKQRGMVKFSRHGDLDDYVSHTYLGLTLMAILARCCAGTLKHTITDRTDAYGSFLKHLEELSDSRAEKRGPSHKAGGGTFTKWRDAIALKEQQAEDLAREDLIAITLDVVDSESLSVDTLVRLRTDKSALASEMRTNYAKAVEEYVDKLSGRELLESDALWLRDEFKRKMTLDLKRLSEELGPLALKTALSKEVAVAIAAPIVGAAVLASSGIGTTLGSALAIGALGKLRAEYRTGRDTIFGKHSMAFLYAAKKMRLY